jgi:G3E family GTPase
MGQAPTSTPRAADPAELRRALDMMDFFSGLVEAASLPDRKDPGRDASIPTVILSGFLGAGKTTLLRHLLTAAHGMKIAVLVNDFAALNIDAALVADVSGDTTALQNGCICCSLSGGVARGLAGIADRETPVDAIVIEASGVSDPSGIAHVAQTVDGIALDCIVAVVDASEPARDDAHGALLARQVAAANLILLNKCDLVSSDAAAAVETRLRASAPRAQVLRTTHCAVPPSLLFNAASLPDFAEADHPVHADQAFATLVLHQTGPVDRAALADCLNNLPEGIFRAKGFLSLSDTPDGPALLQLVGRRWSLSPVAARAGATGLVLIGQGETLGRGAVTHQFAALGLLPG